MRTILLALGLFITGVLFGQSQDSSLWSTKVNTQLNFSQSSFQNWAGGGENAVSATGIFSLLNAYKGPKKSVENAINLAYGMIKQESRNFQKTDDRIEISSKYSQKAFRKFDYSSLLSLRTQFAQGFANAEDTVRISNFMAPGYLIASLGLDYKPKEYFSIMISPLTGKFTFVIDKVLSDAGAFGVEPGHEFRAELGGFLRMNFQKEVMKNINFGTKLEIFSNYLEKPENLDINWETLLAMRVNKHIITSVSTQLIYDDDVDVELDRNGDEIPDGKGPRVQFKEVLSIGIAYTF
ncbi:MAG: hypothetical protein ACJAY8_000193 [Sphingobacteriales bacterium]|jgi:hypothetical protein